MSNQAPILITGVPRSGTSMIAATINICGAFGGEMSKRGRYSNDYIREEIVKPYLKYGERCKFSRLDITDGLLTEGYKDGAWMYKDSNLPYCYQLWNKEFPNAKWVIVRRKPVDIIQSCMKTKYMTAYSTEEGWLSMIHDYEKKFVEMIQEGLNCKVIWPERMVQGDYQQIYELCDWLGLPWKKEALQFINSLLWGNKLKERKVI